MKIIDIIRFILLKWNKIKFRRVYIYLCVCVGERESEFKIDDVTDNM